MKLYCVQETHGEYDEYSERIVLAYDNPQFAYNHIGLANLWVENHREQGYLKDKNPYDKLLNYWYDNIKYKLEEIDYLPNIEDIEFYYPQIKV